MPDRRSAAPDQGPAAPDQGPWEQPDDPGHTHDPNEVTVQLDGVGRQLEDWLVQQAKGAPGSGRDSDGPVFVDASGRRSRRFRRIGMVVGIACAVYAVVIVATLLSGNSSAPWLPVQGQQDEQPAGQVDTSPLPADSADPSGSASGTPSGGATASDGTTPSASAQPGASGSATAPGSGTSTDPKPSSGTTKPNPGTTTKDPDPDPTTSAPTNPDPTTSAPVDPDPSGSAAVGGGSGTVAEAPAEPNPIEPSATSSPSPENIL